jgi:hypothetical protein
MSQNDSEPAPPRRRRRWLVAGGAVGLAAVIAAGTLTGLVVTGVIGGSSIATHPIATEGITAVEVTENFDWPPTLFSPNPEQVVYTSPAWIAKFDQILAGNQIGLTTATPPPGAQDCVGGGSTSIILARSLVPHTIELDVSPDAFATSNGCSGFSGDMSGNVGAFLSDLDALEGATRIPVDTTGVTEVDVTPYSSASSSNRDLDGYEAGTTVRLTQPAELQTFAQSVAAHNLVQTWWGDVGVECTPASAPAYTIVMDRSGLPQQVTLVTQDCSIHRAGNLSGDVPGFLSDLTSLIGQPA